MLPGKALVKFLLICALLSGFKWALLPDQARAYVYGKSNSGHSLRWDANDIFPLVAQSKNRSGLSENTIFKVASRDLQKWSAASGSRILFMFWEGSDRELYPANSDYNGHSSLYFASAHDRQTPPVDSGIIGLTQVWYDTSSGKILEADIVLNDLDFVFTDSPTDTSGPGSGKSGAGSNRVYLDNVLTHEMGHAFGLSHSSLLQSSMFFIEAPDQAHLSCDDQIAIRSIYGAPEQTGSLAGKIADDTGKSVFGVQVVAISRKRGVAAGAALTDKDGNYRIDSLEEDDYFIVAEPYYPGATALPSWYASVDHRICNGNYFGRTFLQEPDSWTLSMSSVRSGTVTSGVDMNVRCGVSGGGAVLGATKGGATLSQATPLIYSDSNSFGFVDRLSALKGSSRQYYDLGTISGKLQVGILSYSLFSQASVEAELLDDAGYPVSVFTTSPVYSSESGFINFDVTLKAENLSPGRYILALRSGTIDGGRYPAGSSALDSVPFVVVSGSLNEAEPALQNVFSNHPKCRMDENFTQYRSPPWGPFRRVEDDDGGGGLFGLCGGVVLPPPSAGPGGGIGQSHPFWRWMGWLLPFVLAALGRYQGSRLRFFRGTVNLGS